MTNPTITIHDVTTNKIVEREMNDTELKQYKIDQAATKIKLDSEKVTQEAKTALLVKLGITAEEAALLLG